MDAWTLVAQIVNFLVFVALMHRILYRPVTGMMQRRRDETEADLQKAREERETAESVRKEAEAREHDLEEKRERILQDAREEARKTREEARRAAEEEAKQRLDRYRRAMENERRAFLEETTDAFEAVVVAAGARLLADAAEPMNDRAIRRVRASWEEAGEDAREAVRDHFRDRDETVRVRSAHPLTDSQQERLRETLTDVTGAEVIDTSFATEDKLVAGVTVALGPMEIRADWGDAVREALAAATADLDMAKTADRASDPDRAEEDAGKQEATS
ncbi:MAG: F0F1 ATP synthase subunit delta [Planctomycetota bacterium]